MTFLFRLLVSGLLASVSLTGWTQQFPDRPITLVVPYSPGAGAGDRVARLMGVKLGDKLGQGVVIDNKPGADGTIGAAFVANARPDGYTLLEGDSGPLAVVPAIRNVNFDVSKLVAVAPMVTLPYVLAVSPKLGVKTVRQLIELAKAHPDLLNSASSSAASMLGMELIKVKTGIKITNVPYSGAAGALNSIIAGQTSMIALNPLALKPFLESGQLVALAICAPVRSPVLPDVPTFEELGIQGVDVQTYLGLFAPRNTPKDVAARLNRAVADVLSDPAIQKELEAQGVVLVKDHSAEGFEKAMEAEREKWRRLVELAGLRKREEILK